MTMPGPGAIMGRWVAKLITDALSERKKNKKQKEQVFNPYRDPNFTPDPNLKYGEGFTMRNP